MPAIGPQPQIVGTSFHGALTQLDVNDNGSPMIVVLRDQGGELRVDDIHVPAEGRSSSMRDTWDLTIAVLEFREGMRTADIGRLQRHSSRNLTGLVWKHVDSIPPLGHVATRHLGAPLSGLRFDGQHALLTLGDEQFGAKVKMVKEHGYYVIDNIELIAGVEPQQRLAFKESVRRQIVMRGPTHQHVSHAQAVEPRPQSGVVNADWVEPAEMPRGNATPLGAEPTFQPR